MNQKWTYAAIAVIITLVAFFFYNKYMAAPSVDFNKIRLAGLDGQRVDFTSFNGKKKVICFSASWCPNCLDELREINAVKQSKLADVEVIVISDESVEKIMAFKDKTHYPFTFLKLEQTFDQVGINAIPTSYLLNASQEIKKEKVGYIDWADPSTAEHLKNLLGR